MLNTEQLAREYRAAMRRISRPSDPAKMAAAREKVKSNTEGQRRSVAASRARRAERKATPRLTPAVAGQVPKWADQPHGGRDAAVLAAAAVLYEPGQVASPCAIAAAMETKASNVAVYIGRLRARGAWPYRRAGRGKARAS